MKTENIQSRKSFFETGLLILCLLSFTGCKTEEQSNADLSSLKASPQCNNVDQAEEEEGPHDCSQNKLEAPTIQFLGEAPLVLTRTPFISWNPALRTEPSAPSLFIPVQIKIVRASDDSTVYPWTSLNGNYVEGLSLIEGEEYLLKMRSIDENGKKSKIVKSEKWTARVGKGTWGTTSTINAPSPREFYSIIWTGSKMIIWGGQLLDGSPTNTGAVYDPSTDSWATMSTVHAPSARGAATAVWTGTEMIIWGGPWNQSGGRYNPTTNSWTTMSTVGSPPGLAGHSAIWTGSKMIVWGGQIPVYGHGWTNQGASYDPSTDTWSAISNVNSPSARDSHLAVWTGSEMIIWGGGSGSNYTSTASGALYNPATDSWSSMTTSGAPSATDGYSPFSGYHWTGSKLILRNGIYDPTTNTWAEVPLASHPINAIDILYLPATAYAFSATVWTGNQFFTWSGWASWASVNTGGLYNPSTNQWTATNLSGAPAPTTTAKAVWTGNKVLIWTGSAGATYTPP